MTSRAHNNKKIKIEAQPHTGHIYSASLQWVLKTSTAFLITKAVDSLPQSLYLLCTSSIIFSQWFQQLPEPSACKVQDVDTCPDVQVSVIWTAAIPQFHNQRAWCQETLKIEHGTNSFCWRTEEPIPEPLLLNIGCSMFHSSRSNWIIQIGKAGLQIYWKN